MEKDMNFKLTVRFYTEDKVFGPGIAQLLHRVVDHHSLRAAAISMNMAYSKAWTVLRNAERVLGFKLLHSSTALCSQRRAGSCWRSMTSSAPVCAITARSNLRTCF